MWIVHAVALRDSWVPQPPAIAQSSHGAAPEPRSPLRRNLEARRDAEFATVRDTFGPLHAFDAWHLVFYCTNFYKQIYHSALLVLETRFIPPMWHSGVCFQSPALALFLPARSSPVTLSSIRSGRKNVFCSFLAGVSTASPFSAKIMPLLMKSHCCAHDATCSNVMRTWGLDAPFSFNLFYFVTFACIGTVTP